MNETNQMYMRTHFSGVGSEVEGRAEEARLTSSSFLTAGRYSLIGSYCITYTEHKKPLLKERKKRGIASVNTVTYTQQKKSSRKKE